MYMDKITLEMLPLAFCVCVSSENKACGNLLELTNKPLNGLNFNSLNLPFQVLQNTEC